MFKRILILIIIFSTIVSAEIRMNEFLPNPIGDDDAPMPEGEWVELYNSGSEDIDLEGYSFYDNDGHNPDIVIANTNTYSTIIKSKDYLIVYMNGRAQFLNNEGFEKINLTDLNNSLADEVTYSNSKEGISWSKVDGIWQYGLPTPNEENKGNKSIEDSKIKINKIYYEDAKWGDVIKVKFDIYKADTNKNSIKIYIENDNNKIISEETNLNIYGKLSNYNLKIPLKIIDNCDNKFKDGEYNLIVEGLDTKDSEEIKIEGDNCKIIETNNTIINKENVFKDEAKIENDDIKSETVIYHKKGVLYQSKGNEASRYALFFLNGISVLLLLYYIFKK